jgi:predicted DNA-binding transcriptional regulator AlpA
MNFDIYFPLFENILNGNLNPLLPANDDGYHYTARLEEMIIVSVKDTGIYGLNFQQPFNLKTRYYHRKILADTLLYIADMHEMLQDETNSKIRSFLRNQLLDKHLTTCLMRLGEKIQKEALYIELLNDLTNQVSNNQLSNIFVFQFLKVCIARAYLEIQDMLSDVVVVKQSEAMLYSSLVCEKFPVKQFLKRRKPPEIKNETTSIPAISKETHYTTKEALAVLGYSESTLLRQKKHRNFPLAVKLGNKDMYLKSDIDAWSIARH